MPVEYILPPELESIVLKIDRAIDVFVVGSYAILVLLICFFIWRLLHWIF